MVAELERAGKMDFAAVRRCVPMGRLARPDEIALAVPFSDQHAGALHHRIGAGGRRRLDVIQAAGGCAPAGGCDAKPNSPVRPNAQTRESCSSRVARTA